MDCGGDDEAEAAGVNCNVDAPDLYNTNEGAFLFDLVEVTPAVDGCGDNDGDGGVGNNEEG